MKRHIVRSRRQMVNAIVLREYFSNPTRSLWACSSEHLRTPEGKKYFKETITGITLSSDWAKTFMDHIRYDGVYIVWSVGSPIGWHTTQPDGMRIWYMPAAGNGHDKMHRQVLEDAIIRECEIAVRYRMQVPATVEVH